jgi:hypothetical protein
MKMNGYFGALQIVEKVNQVKLAILVILHHQLDLRTQELGLEDDYLEGVS